MEEDEAALFSKTFREHLYYTPKRFGCQGFGAEIALNFWLSKYPASHFTLDILLKG